MKRILLMLIAATVAVFAVSCRKKPFSSAATGYVEGQLLDESTNAPIPLAKMTVEGFRPASFPLIRERWTTLKEFTTDRNGNFTITFNGNHEARSFAIKAARADSLELGQQVEVRIRQKNVVTVKALKLNYKNVRIIVHKNEGRALKFNNRLLVTRTGPIDTTIKVWGKPGQIKSYFLGTYDAAEMRYRGKWIDFQLHSDNSGLETLEVQDMMQLP